MGQSKSTLKEPAGIQSDDGESAISWQQCPISAKKDNPYIFNKINSLSNELLGCKSKEEYQPVIQVLHIPNKIKCISFVAHPRSIHVRDKCRLQNGQGTNLLPFLPRLHTVTLPNSGLTVIEPNSFAKAIGITSIWTRTNDWTSDEKPTGWLNSFPETLTDIRDNAFSGCKDLTEVKLPHSIEHIGKHAFHFNTEIKVRDSYDNVFIAKCTPTPKVIAIEMVEGNTQATCPNCFDLDSSFIPKGVTITHRGIEHKKPAEIHQQETADTPEDQAGTLLSP